MFNEEILKNADCVCAISHQPMAFVIHAYFTLMERIVIKRNGVLGTFAEHTIPTGDAVADHR